MPQATDTIAAVATPPGRGGIGVVRISGPLVPDIAARLLDRQPSPRQATLCRFIDADQRLIDQGIAIWFKAPDSYTGEDVLELQAHGSPVILDALVARSCALGARPARPGEFTERAYLNGKLDLAQAEAVADLIDSASIEAARCAQRSLQGVFSERVGTMVEELTDVRTHIEAWLDFPDEDISPGELQTLQARLAALRAATKTLLADAAEGSRLREGLNVVIAGAPNVGKSSLMNQLARNERAIVTDRPGTTRDTLHESILIQGLAVHLTDTAGIRTASDAIEKEGVRRTHAAITRADVVLLVIDDTEPEATADVMIEPGMRCITVHNKIDLSGAEPHSAWTGDQHHVYLSAKLGTGLDILAAILVQGPQPGDSTPGGDSAVLARRRHLEALTRAQELVQRAHTRLAEQALELCAEDLRIAQQALSSITGTVSADDLLGRIFSEFCIGK